MSKHRFMVPQTKRLELSEGDWIEVKCGLSYGENRRLLDQTLRQTGSIGEGDSKVELDFESNSVHRLMAWLADWSLVDADENHVELTIAAIKALDQESADEIDAALNKHIEALAEKKASTKSETKSATA